MTAMDEKRSPGAFEEPGEDTSVPEDLIYPAHEWTAEEIIRDEQFAQSAERVYDEIERVLAEETEQLWDSRDDTPTAQIRLDD